MCKQDKIKETIKKLLQRTTENGCTAEEAAAAIAQAHKLLAEHNLTVSELEDNDNQVDSFQLDSDTKGISLAQHWLSGALAKHFGVELYTRKRGSYSSIMVVGEKYKAEVFKETFNFAYNSFKKLWSSYVKNIQGDTSYKLKLRNDYLAGFSDGFTNEIIKQENEFALVVVKSAEVEKYMDSLQLTKGRPISYSRANSCMGYDAGYSAGAFAQRNKNKVIA